MYPKMVNNPEVFWGVVSSMYVGNFMLLALGPILERSFLQSLYLVQGEWMEIFLRPITAGMILTGLVVLVAPALLRLARGGAARQRLA